jgi:hypothetical protein
MAFKGKRERGGGTVISSTCKSDRPPTTGLAWSELIVSLRIEIEERGFDKHKVAPIPVFHT